MRITRTLAFILIAAGAACTPAPDKRPAKVDIKAEEAKLMDASRRWSALAAQGQDAGAVADYWGDDAAVMLEGIPTIRGREAARKMVEGAFKTPGFKISWQPIEAHVAASGDMGYLIERTTVTEPGADGKPVTSEERAVTIWRKGSDGQWRNAVDISNAQVKAK